MGIPRIHGIPEAAIRYFVREYVPTLQPNPFWSIQQYWQIACLSDADLAIWIAANAGNPAEVILHDLTEHWLYGETLTFTCYAGGAVPAVPDDEFHCNLVSQAGWTALQVKQGWYAQINAYARDFLSHGTKLYTLKAVDIPGYGGTTNLKILSPVAMAGAANVTGVHPFVFTALRNGFFWPLWYGILGRRRHVFSWYPPEPRID
jgi:hypothetical protein